jgi:hypothetical protein
LSNSYYLRWFPVLRKRISVLVTTIAVLAGGITFGAAPANAAITGESIDPVEWQPGATNLTTVKWTDSLTKTGLDLNKVVYVEVEWDWNATFTTGTTQSTVSGTTATCPQGITFSSPGFTFTGQPNCVIRNSGAGQQKYVVLQDRDGSNLFDYAGGQEITVTFPSAVITASTVPKRYRWTVKSMAAINVSSNFAYLYPFVPSADGTVPAPPPIRLEINGNGGVCTPSFVEGEQGTWGTAPTADKCTFGSRQLIGFSTSPTLASGSVFVPPGGPVYFLTPNLLYAIWASTPASAPQDVVATAGVNEVNISWKAPADLGASSISNYLVQAKPSGRVCVTSTVRDQNPLTCTMSLAATNTKYTFEVQALNGAGWGAKSAASNEVSPYNVVLGEVSRTQDRVLFIKTGSTLDLKGRAPGVPQGTVVTPQIKIGSGQWTSETRNLPKVGRDQSITWSKKLNKAVDNQPVQVRLTVLGASAESTPVKVGARAGVPTAPRNVKVTITEDRIPAQRKLQVSWVASANDGGSPITSYEVSAQLFNNSLPVTCRVNASQPLTCTLRVNVGALDKRKTYTAKVTATNARGQSQPAMVDFRRS